MKRFKEYSSAYIMSILAALGVGSLLGVLATAVISILILVPQA
jgi:hypothetical protein